MYYRKVKLLLVVMTLCFAIYITAEPKALLWPAMVFRDASTLPYNDWAIHSKLLNEAADIHPQTCKKNAVIFDELNSRITGGRNSSALCMVQWHHQHFCIVCFQLDVVDFCAAIRRPRIRHHDHLPTKSGMRDRCMFVARYFMHHVISIVIRRAEMWLFQVASILSRPFW